MNKKLILAIAFSLLCNALAAQNHEDQWVWPDEMKTDVLSFHLDAGPVIGGGMTFATDPTLIPAAIPTVIGIKETDPTLIPTDFRSSFCYQLGIAANGRLAYQKSPQPHGISRLGMGVEVLLRKSSIKTEDEPFHLLSLDVPIMVHFYVTSGLILEVGATLVKSLKTSPEWLLFGPIPFQTDIIESNDIMLSVGAGYKTPIGLALELRYNHGNSYLSETLDSKISTLAFSVSYRFSIIK